MKVRHCILALALATGGSCASPGTNEQGGALHDAAIIERSAIPPYTGYIRTWIQFKVRSNGMELVMLLPHFEDGKRIPEIGETCQIRYHTEVIEGQVGDKDVRDATANVLDQMECEGPEV